MAEGDWEDPFAEEEAARDRERRRAEREARRRMSHQRRRKSRGALADRVRDLLTSDGEPPAADPPPAAAAPPPNPPAPARTPSDAHRRRRLIAIGAVAAVIAIVVLIAAIRNSSDENEAPVTTHAAPARELTIPEGYDRRQVAAVAEEAGLRGDYMKASESAKGFDPAKYGAQDPASLEGFLFPATYELPRRPSAEDLVVRQLAAFKQYVSKVRMSYARSKNLTTYDVVTIASMIEREVAVSKERKLVAAVIYNRLRDGRPLQIDATIRFAEGNYTEPLTSSDLELDSPYNTYVNAGLPPGPIGNPGLASIEAAAHPAKVPYQYYVVKPDTCGEHSFATTEAQFERAKAAYDQAREAAGGQAPTPANCPGG